MGAAALGWGILLAGSMLPLRLQAQVPLLLQAPASPELACRGMLATEGGAVGSGVQIGPYPVAGVAGLVAAIATHAAINQSVQSSQRKREQDAADRVLQPYLPALSHWSASSLWDAVAASAPADSPLKITASSALPPGESSVEIVPAFTMAQDEGVVLADVLVRVREPSRTTPAEVAVRVVSSPHGAADARGYWSANEARALKAVAANMVAHAIELARRHGNAVAPELPMRSHRYLQGGIERVERAQRLGGDCSRAVLRTLRGGLMSVPLPAPADSPCPRTSDF